MFLFSFLGYLIDDKSISQDPQKTMAVGKMNQPTTVIQLRRFLGMINKMSKFSPNLSQTSVPDLGTCTTKKGF